MKFRVIIWHWENKLFDKEVEYETQALADAFTMGLYHAFAFNDANKSVRYSVLTT